MLIRFWKSTMFSKICTLSFCLGKNWDFSFQNAATRSQTALPKLLIDIWVICPFQKRMLILWRWLSSRQTIYLSHISLWYVWSTSRNHTLWKMSVYQKGCRRYWNINQYMPWNPNWRFADETDVSETCAPSRGSETEGWSHISWNWPSWVS